MIVQTSAAYFWTMLAVAFAIGAAAGLGICRSERRRSRAALSHAVELLDEAQVTVAMVAPGYLPLLRRIREFRFTLREGAAP